MYALADGHQLYPTPDGTWHYLTPDENAVTIGAPAEDLAELDNFLRRSGSVLGPGAIEIADALVSRGVLAVPGQVPEIPRPQRVLMDGIGPVADACIAPALQGSSASRGRIHYCANRRRRCVVGPRTVGCRCSSSRRVVGTRDLVPPKPNTVATRPRGAGRDLHRTFFDGIGQRKLPGRLRSTLAASRVPDHLQALWNHLAGSEPRPLELEPTAAAMASALACSDVVAGVHGAPPSHLHHQIRMNPRTLMMTRHPVLPLPGGVLEPAPTLR